MVQGDFSRSNTWSAGYISPGVGEHHAPLLAQAADVAAQSVALHHGTRDRNPTKPRADTASPQDPPLATPPVQPIDSVYSVAFQKDGKILVAGGEHGSTFGVIRYNTDGKPDLTFGRNGVVTIRFGGGAEVAHAVALDYAGTPATNPNYGKILIAGSSGGRFAVARLTATGKLDKTFGRDGKLSGMHRGTISGLIVMSDGRILVGGRDSIGPVVVRLNARGKMDRRLGTHGIYHGSLNAISGGQGGGIVLHPSDCCSGGGDSDGDCSAGNDGDGDGDDTDADGDANSGLSDDGDSDGDDPTPSYGVPSIRLPTDTAPITITEGGTLEVDGGLNDGDPNARWGGEVNFGDGSGWQQLPVNNDGSFNWAHRYVEEGTYTLTVTGVDIDTGQSGSGSGTIHVNDAALTGTAAVFGATAQSPFSNTLIAGFSDASTALATDFTLSIDWGDGATSGGVIQANGNGSFSVFGGHTYLALGQYPVSLTINDDGGSTVTFSSYADVGPAPSQTPLNLTATAVSNQEIDLSWSADTSGNAVGYNIYRSTTASFTPGSNNIIAAGVSGTSYQDTTVAFNTAYYYLVTSVNAAGAESAASNQTQATTPDTPPAGSTPISAQGTAFAAVAGQIFNGTVATFTGGDGSFSISINWGDGNASGGSVQGNANSGYSVTGQHTYANSGQYQVTVTIDDGSQGYAADSTASVSDSQGLSVEGAPVNGTAGTDTGSIVVANIFSPNGNVPTSNFTTTVNWGDGTSSAGAVGAQQGSDVYPVTADHTYAVPGTYTVTISVLEQGVGSASTDSTAQIGAGAGSGSSATLQNPSGTLKLGLWPLGTVGGLNSAGLGYTPDNQAALWDIPDGWGVADATSGFAGYSDYFNGTSNLSVKSFTSTPTTAVSDVSAGSVFDVVQSFHPLATGNPSQPIDPYLYAIDIYITNTTNSPVHLLYRRTMDWDASGVEGNEYVSNQQYNPQNPDRRCVYDNNDDVAPANPLGPQIPTSHDDTPQNLLQTGSFSESGPGDLGTMFQFDFGTLAPRAAQQFTLFYGAAPSEDQAVQDISQATNDGTYSLVHNKDQQTTFMFGYLGGAQLGIDMATDSNNNGTIETGYVPGDDEPIKDDPNLPGKVIVADTLDQTGTNVPGYADWGLPIWNNSPNDLFAPINLTLINPGGALDLNKARIRFVYSSAEPSLVTSTNVGSDIPRYDPGSAGVLRLWTPTGGQARNPASVADTNLAGNFIPANTALSPWTVFKNGSTSTATIYAEGINATDPANTRIEVDIDPNGTGVWALHDYVRVTVASVQVVYTDVSGISHAGGYSATNVPRIPSDIQPEGIAADWKNGVDDGALLLVRLVGSPAITTLAQQAEQTNNFQVAWGESYKYVQFVNTVIDNDGVVQPLNSGPVFNSGQWLSDLGIANIGQQWGSGNLTVLAGEFYQPPAEFDLTNGTLDTRQFRRIPLAVQVNLHGQDVLAGGKPEGLMLTRAPLVLVHGIDSSSDVWNITPKGGQSFVQAATAAGYPTTFRADHSGYDPARPNEGQTNGEGEITDMYKVVENTIGVATAAYRAGNYFPVDPYMPADPNGFRNARIAVQKVDVVGHSYGGLLARWYIEQSPEYGSRRDVRNVIELGTPNLGTPLANMVEEAYTDPLIGGAGAAGTGGTVPLVTLLRGLNAGANYLFPFGSTGFPSAVASGASPREFFLDDGVNSIDVQQLASTPFNNDIGYAAVVGTQPTIEVSAPFGGTLVSINLFNVIQPLAPDGHSYFPWISQFAAAEGSDLVVPIWSAQLGNIPGYNFQVPVNHLNEIEDSRVQARVIQWLADSALPLGSAQRAAYTNQPPLSEQNAYSPTGLNPNAIVGITFPDTGTTSATFGTSASQVGIKSPVLTGMIKKSDIGSLDFRLLEVDNGEYGTSLSLLNDLGNLTTAAQLGVTQAQLDRLGNNDWVAFRVANVARIGRRHVPQLTGPDGTGKLAFYNSPAPITYTMGDLPGDHQSPQSQVSLPVFSLAPPVVSTAAGVIKLSVSGGVEWTAPAGGSQTNEVDIFADSGSGVLLQQGSVVVYPPAGVWDGLLLPYNGAVFLGYDSSGNVTGSNGNSGQQHPKVYQFLYERSGVPDTISPDVAL